SVLVICAAGNNGADDSVGYPGSDSRTVAVGAIDKNNNLAPFSSRGPEVDVVAYGVNILSCYINGGYGEMSGTSMACPNAAAIMANRLSYEWARGLPATKTYPQAISLF